MSHAREIQLDGPGNLRLGPWVPVAALAVLMVVGVVASPAARFDPPWLLPILNFLFQTLIPLVAAGIAVVAYRRTGVAAVLALGAAMLGTALGCGILPALLIFGPTPTDGIAVHNTSAALAAGGHFAAAVGAIVGLTFGPQRNRHIVLAYGGVVAGVAVILGLTETRLMPPFWDEGPTPLRVTMLAVGAFLFGASALSWWQTAMRDRSIRFLSWYVPGLVLLALGIAVLVPNGVIGGLLSWLGRAGQYLGAVYLLVAVAPEGLAFRTGREERDRSLGISLLQAALPFRPLVESTSDAVVAVGRTGRVLYWNDAARRLFGYGPAEAFDREPGDLLLRPEAPAPTRALVARLLGTPATLHDGERHEIQLADRRGRTFIGEIASFAAPEDPRLVVGVIRDITKRVRSREELERMIAERTEALAAANGELERVNEGLEEANRDLARANAAKDEFLGLVSHELKTPITSILAASAILERRATGAGDDLARDVAAEAARLGGIVDNLLVLARLDAGLSLESEPLPLERLVRTAVDAMAREYPDREIHVSTEHGVIVEGNADQLVMVLRNLLSNALKYSPVGIPVDVVLHQGQGVARLSVLDRGIGIDDADSDRLFDPFWRSQRTERVAGIGIGLTVCKRIIEFHGGSVGASLRRDGPGSVFWFELPLAFAELPPEPRTHLSAAR